MAKGFYEEVENLVQRGYCRGTVAMQSLGYEELLDLREGKCQVAEAVASIKLRTRQYAKRQLTWLRGWESATKLEPAAPDVRDELARRIQMHFDTR